MNQMQGGGSRVMNFGKSKAKRMSVDAPKITFRDVAGVDEAVQELHEIKEFLENPKKFQALGARIPKGVLLYGPPGHRQDAARPRRRRRGRRALLLDLRLGLRRDVRRRRRQPRPRPLRAGQAELALHHLHGRDRRRRPPPRRRHGRRPRRARADAEPAAGRDGRLRDEGQHHLDRRHQPARTSSTRRCCGRAASTARSSSTAPTARAASRSSRSTPAASRSAKEIDLDTLAGQTPGFTGADLANLINEAALLTARTGKREITMKELEEGIMRVIAGPEKKTRVMSEKERLITAYHEMGHAIVGHLLPNCDPVHKISIISRGQALGYTISLPTEDKFLTTPRRADRHDGDDPGRPRRRGDRLRRDHHRRLQRPRKGDRDGEADGDALRHVRAPRPARLRPRPRPALPRPRVLLRARLLRRDRPRDRRRDPPHRRGAPTRPPRTCSPRSASELDRISKILLERETIDAEQFVALLEGKPEEEVFVDEEEPAARPSRRRARKGPARGRAANPRPRPGSPAATPVRPRPRAHAGLRPAMASAFEIARSTAPRTPPADRAILPRVKVMGVVNVTPDSFSDGGLYLDPEAAIAHGRELAERGRRDPRRRRRVDAAGGGGGRRGGGAARGSSRSSRAWRHAAHGLDRHLEASRSPRRRSTPARRSSTTSPRCAATPRWRRSAPSGAPSSS